MRYVKPHNLTIEEEEIAIEHMIRRKNRESAEKYDDKIENDIRILNKHHLFQAAIGFFKVECAKKIHGVRFMHVSLFRLKTKGKRIEKKLKT